MFKEPENHIIAFTICVVIGVFLLCLLVLTLGYLLQRKQHTNQIEIAELIESHKASIMKVEVQTQQDTFAKVSAEISRTVGWKLEDVESKLVSSLPLITEENILIAKLATVTLTDAVEELRDTSRSMSSEIVKHYGLQRAIEIELDQLLKYKIFSTKLKFDGEQICLKPYDELLVFRIIQEGVKNAVRHSGGHNITVSVHFHTERLTVVVQDDGVGYPENILPEVGKGLFDVHQRLRMLRGSCEFLSDKGASLKICVPLTKDNVLLEPFKRKEIVIQS